MFYVERQTRAQPRCKCSMQFKTWAVSKNKWNMSTRYKTNNNTWTMFQMSYMLAPNKEMLTPLLTFCLCAHRFCLRAHLVLPGAYAVLRWPQFCLCHTLTRGPFLNMNSRVSKVDHLNWDHLVLKCMVTWGYHFNQETTVSSIVDFRSPCLLLVEPIYLPQS